MSIKKPIAIIGAGIAGLTAAKYLKEQNEPFILFEAGTKIAGLAASFKGNDGFSHDFGAHFVTNRLANAIGVNSECRLVKHYGEAMWLKGRSYSYPFGLITIPRMALSFLKTKFKSLQGSRQTKSAKEWFRDRYGTSFSDEVALPLVEAWSGAMAEELSPAVGASLPGSILKTLYLKAASILTGRAVACGYNREMPEKPSVWHVYPNGGVATLCNKLAEGLGDYIKLGSPVQKILIENNRVTGVHVKSEIIEVSAVISTAPANILAKMVRGTDLLKGFESFRFRPMIFVNLRLEGTKLLPDTVLWFPEKEFPFFRLTEVTRSMPWLAPIGKSIITVDIGCQKDDEFWNMDENKLTTCCLKKLKIIIPDIEKRLLGSNVLRTPIAYPVFLNEYEKERQDFEQSTHIDNLLSIGRNGEFAHRFMEDVYWRTRKKIQNFIEKNA
ncbi:MAG: FAD-dependent oxidoreductase [Bacteroidota bacterium]|nr:FAD-dependent oxidoreductase [Bacteroidota bacterium]